MRSSGRCGDQNYPRPGVRDLLTIAMVRRTDNLGTTMLYLGEGQLVRNSCRGSNSWKKDVKCGGTEFSWRGSSEPFERMT
jgi:hypothetical protein